MGGKMRLLERRKRWCRESSPRKSLFFHRALNNGDSLFWSPHARSPFPTHLSPPQQRFLSPTINPIKAEGPRWHWDTSGEGWHRAPSNRAGRHAATMSVWGQQHQKAPQKHPGSVCSTWEAPSQTLWGCSHGRGKHRERSCRACLQCSWILPSLFKHIAWHSQRWQPDKC